MISIFLGCILLQRLHMLHWVVFVLCLHFSGLLLLVCPLYYVLSVSKPLWAFFTGTWPLSGCFFSPFPSCGGWRVLPLLWTVSVCCIWFRCHLKGQVTHQNDYVIPRFLSFTHLRCDRLAVFLLPFMGLGMGFLWGSEAQACSTWGGSVMVGAYFFNGFMNLVFGMVLLKVKSASSGTIWALKFPATTGQL